MKAIIVMIITTTMKIGNKQIRICREKVKETIMLL